MNDLKIHRVPFSELCINHFLRNINPNYGHKITVIEDNASKEELIRRCNEHPGVIFTSFQHIKSNNPNEANIHYTR